MLQAATSRRSWTIPSKASLDFHLDPELPRSPFASTAPPHKAQPQFLTKADRKFSHTRPQLLTNTFKTPGPTLPPTTANITSHFTTCSSPPAPHHLLLTTCSSPPAPHHLLIIHLLLTHTLTTLPPSHPILQHQTSYTLARKRLLELSTNSRATPILFNTCSITSDPPPQSIIPTTDPHNLNHPNPPQLSPATTSPMAPSHSRISHPGLVRDTLKLMLKDWANDEFMKDKGLRGVLRELIAALDSIHWSLVPLPQPMEISLPAAMNVSATTLKMVHGADCILSLLSLLMPTYQCLAPAVPRYDYQISLAKLGKKVLSRFNSHDDIPAVVCCQVGFSENHEDPVASTVFWISSTRVKGDADRTWSENQAIVNRRRRAYREATGDDKCPILRNYSAPRFECDPDKYDALFDSLQDHEAAGTAFDGDLETATAALRRYHLLEPTFSKWGKCHPTSEDRDLFPVPQARPYLVDRTTTPWQVGDCAEPLGTLRISAMDDITHWTSVAIGTHRDRYIRACCPTCLAEISYRAMQKEARFVDLASPHIYPHETVRDW
ncbi:hypothetical protein BJ508DRAFT_365568 [Ascobolus immersus RN42]|uniref:Uncharacterized protein n=1 Tax=Ascobolus immersus RN42 TaxID=1160509 RepID=A0A3N4HP13_ASCIM|nr:hypothetical protein BJ508DRAFT_365568 [Ascobolus immersus RN42]